MLLEENKIYLADCLKFLKTMPDKSVDLFILDPPYYKVVSQEWDKQWFTIEEYINWCKGWLFEVGRVSKWSTSVWLFGFSYQLIQLFSILTDNGFNFRQQIMVNKGMQAVAGRTSNKLKMFPTATESIFFFHKDARDHIRDLLQSEQQRLGLIGKQINEHLGKAITGGGTYSCIASLKKPKEHRSYPTKQDWRKLSEIMNLPAYEDVVYSFNIIKGLTDVWNDINFYDRKVKKIHETQKPEKLIDRLILSSSNEGDLVCDPFMGSGTTAVSCMKNNRRYIGCEMDQEYFDKIEDRIINVKKEIHEREQKKISGDVTSSLYY